jgi:hypothetical protein
LVAAPKLQWEVLSDRKAMVELQRFTCTTPSPRSPRGRRLIHPRPWELEAQSLLRNVSHSSGSEDLVLIGRGVSEPADWEIRAVAWCEWHEVEVTPALFIKTCGVSLEFRRQSGEAAGELMEQIFEVARQRLAEQAEGQVVIHGNIHVRNVPSERLFSRFGFEPVGLPISDYQKWSVVLQ